LSAFRAISFPVGAHFGQWCICSNLELIAVGFLELQSRHGQFLEQNHLFVCVCVCVCAHKTTQLNMDILLSDYGSCSGPLSLSLSPSHLAQLCQSLGQIVLHCIVGSGSSRRLGANSRCDIRRQFHVELQSEHLRKSQSVSLKPPRIALRQLSYPASSATCCIKLST
jgi:hypothetical protein